MDKTSKGDNAASVELTEGFVISSVSGDYEALLGLQAGELLGRSLTEVLFGDQAVDWPSVVARGAEDVGSAAGARREVMAVTSKSGLRSWVRVESSKTNVGYLLRVARASGREVVERDPRAVYEALKTGLAEGGVGLWLDDGITDETDWSDRGRELYDLPLGEPVTHAAFFQKIHPEDAPRVAAEVQQAIADRTPYNSSFRTRDGDGYRHLHTFGTVVYDERGAVLLGAGGMREISEVEALRARVNELEQQLRQAQRMDVVGRLAGGVAHDFNNLLTGILMCHDLLRNSDLSVTQVRDLELIRDSSLKGAELTRQLLAFGRRQALQRAVVHCDDIAAEAHRLLSRTVPESVRIELSSNAGDARISVDTTQLHQVLANLVVNAAQAMPDGGRVLLSTRQRHLPDLLVPEGSGEYVVISVADTGPGIEPEVGRHIFEPFFTTKAPGQGTGLGLSVVQGIVEQHNGFVRMTSGTAGTTFDVYLPKTSAELTSERPAVKTPRPDRHASVLLIEDEHMVREVTQRILEGAGFRVTVAAGPEEALELARVGTFELILSDVVLPGSTGPEVVAQLRREAKGLHAVYMSGYSSDFIESRVKLEPGEFLLQKPFTSQSLLSVLNRALG